MREYLGEPHGPMADRRGRQTSRDAEDGLRGGMAHPARHPGQRHGIGVGAAADHQRGGADARPAAPHAAGLAGLPRAQADSDDQQRAAAAHPRRRAGRGRRAVRWASRHPGRRWPGTGVAHRPGGRTRGGVLPQHPDPRVPRDLDRRTGAGARRARRGRPARGVLGAGDAAARSVEVRVLLRRLRGVPRAHRRGDVVARGLGATRRRRR